MKRATYDEQAERRSTLFKALMHPVRFRLLQVLSASESGLSVGEIDEAMGMPPEHMTPYLHALYEAGLVKRHKQYPYVIYRVNFEHLLFLIEALSELTRLNDYQFEEPSSEEYHRVDIGSYAAREHRLYGSTRL